MRRPLLLDLFCGAGGAAAGYHRAGFDVVGIDLAPQPRYPFAFLQADALAYLALCGRGFDAIHASPPCQRYTAGRRAQRLRGEADPHPDLIAVVREALVANGRPWVIENVEGSPLVAPARLCGQGFGLRVIRHRLFEASFPLPQPPHARHTGSMLDGSIVAVYGGKWLVSGGARKGEDRYVTYGRIPLEFQRLKAKQEAMGIDWMTGAELGEAVPPAYTEYVGGHLRRHLATMLPTNYLNP